MNAQRRLIELGLVSFVVFLVLIACISELGRQVENLHDELAARDAVIAKHRAAVIEHAQQDVLEIITAGMQPGCEPVTLP